MFKATVITICFLQTLAFSIALECFTVRGCDEDKATKVSHKEREYWTSVKEDTNSCLMCICAMRKVFSVNRNITYHVSFGNSGPPLIHLFRQSEVIFYQNRWWQMKTFFWGFKKVYYYNESRQLLRRVILIWSAYVSIFIGERRYSGNERQMTL